MFTLYSDRGESIVPRHRTPPRTFWPCNLHDLQKEKGTLDSYAQGHVSKTQELEDVWEWLG